MRLFLGIPLPPSPAYAEVTEELLHACQDARPVPPGSWHVTLRFLGSGADPAAVEAAVRDAVAGYSSMPAVVRGLGAFQSPQRARVVWAGVEATGLTDLAEAVVAATAGLGQPPDERAFRAHATLARIKHPADLSGWLRRHEATRLAEGVLDRLVLWRSVLGREGPQYEVVETFPLQASGERTAVADRE
jgi:RNA 2',3'-cyclic 3'-phosphodiesterase